MLPSMLFLFFDCSKCHFQNFFIISKNFFSSNFGPRNSEWFYFWGIDSLIAELETSSFPQKIFFKRIFLTKKDSLDSEEKKAGICTRNLSVVVTKFKVYLKERKIYRYWCRWILIFKKDMRKNKKIILNIDTLLNILPHLKIFSISTYYIDLFFAKYGSEKNPQGLFSQFLPFACSLIYKKRSIENRKRHHLGHLILFITKFSNSLNFWRSSHLEAWVYHLQ